MKCRWLVIIIVMVLLTGCSIFKFNKEPETEPAETLAVSGMEAYDQKDYKEALDKFQQLKDWYPFSNYVVMAELRIGDSHYHLEEYDQAILAYREFMDLHPSNEAIPYVLYQIGRCYYDQIEATDRDQSATQQAMATFQRLKARFPKSSYADKATDHINKCLEKLTRSEFYIGFFYYKQGRYEAAMNRFKTLIKKYPDVGIHQEALLYIAKCEAYLAPDENADSDKK